MSRRWLGWRLGGDGFDICPLIDAVRRYWFGVIAVRVRTTRQGPPKGLRLIRWRFAGFLKSPQSFEWPLVLAGLLAIANVNEEGFGVAQLGGIRATSVNLKSQTARLLG